MEQSTFEALMKTLLTAADLPQALQMLKDCEEVEIAQAAEALTGQFSLAEIEGKQRVYHVFTEADEAGVEQEYVEHVMNLDDEILVFVAWFFYSQFDITHRETYAAAGRTYQQPKKS